VRFAQAWIKGIREHKTVSGMKAGILYNDRDIRVGDAPDPRIGSDEVLVATSYAGICGTDLHIYRGEFHDRVAYPAIPGHEFGGIIEQVGKDVR
jgi:D-arabinose 1-dehydrogenase-like Zn-dependent alcohol dehydrogenase